MKSILVVALFISLGLQLVGCTTPADTHYEIGALYQRTGDPEKAIAEFRTALRLNPNHVLAHNDLGIALAKKGDLEEAIAEFRTALRLAPNYVSPHYELGKAFQAKGDLVLARKEFEEALRLIPQTSENQATIKTIQSNLRDLEKLQP